MSMISTVFSLLMIGQLQIAGLGPHPTLTQTQPLPDLVSVAGKTENGPQIGIGLAAVRDWSSQQPFLDVMKTARQWIGHKPKRWGGMEYRELAEGGFLDDQGWPVAMPRSLSSIGTLVLTDMPDTAVSLAGRYVLRFDGQGVIEVSGRARNIRYGAGEVRFDYTPGPGPVEIRIQRINRAAPLRNITLVREDHLDLFDAGALFNPDWTARLAHFKSLRFMDWAETNNSDLAHWADRPLVSDVSYAQGVPVEVMIALANQLQINPWFNLPHQGDDDFVRAFAQMVRDDLDPDLTAYVEYSNEVWNWQFAQARWADEQALVRWGHNDKWMQYYGVRAAEVAQIWTQVFDGSADHRLVNVISSQTGWLGLETEAMNAPMGQAKGAAAPVEAFDAYAITGYFGGVLGLEDREAMVKTWLADSLLQAQTEALDADLSGQGASAYIAAHRYDLANAMAGRELFDGSLSNIVDDTLDDLIGRVWPYHAQVAQEHGLDLLIYEGGSHVVGIGGQVEDAELTAFFQQFNYSPEMGMLYQSLLAGWHSLDGKLFMGYSDVYNPTKWGSWGGLRHLDDQNPRWDALIGLQ